MPKVATPVLLIASQVEPDAKGEEIVALLDGLHRGGRPAHLITTQPAENRGVRGSEAKVDEFWDLPDVMPGGSMPGFLLTFIESRRVGIVHIFESRLGFDLLPDIACLAEPPVVVARMPVVREGENGYERYVGRRYGNLVDAFSVGGETVKDSLSAEFIPPSRIEVIPPGETVAAAHAALYERLLGARPASSRWRADELFGADQDGDENEPEDLDTGPIRLPRMPPPKRSVGIIVPCFRHGIFLDECIESIKAQTMAPARVVVVDDGSDDPETIAALDALDDDPTIDVLRQGENRGPSAARNRALEVLDTSYVLPIDADDRLLPEAVELMVSQLEAAPEDVGFVYPHVRHFGNRDDFVRMPAYNLWLLMQENYCPAPAMFDRRVFGDGGVSYPEEIVVGHEDWDLVLQLGARGVHGIHAAGPTFLYRRLGFSRVNAIDYGPHQFHDLVRKRHAALYDASTQIKMEWAPAVSVILLDGEEPWRTKDLAGINSQTCLDFELLASSPFDSRVRTVGGPGNTPTAWLQTALDAACGRWLCVLAPAAAAALADPTFVERLITMFNTRVTTHAVALAISPGSDRPSFALLGEEERQRSRPVGFALERRAAYKLPRLSLSGDGELLSDLLLELQPVKDIEWRRAPGEARSSGPASEEASVRLDFDPILDRSEFATRDLIAHQPPRLSEQERHSPHRWSDEEGWTPPATNFLCRHISTDGSHRMVANHLGSPPGYLLEFILGAIHRDAAPGLRRLVYADHNFSLTDEQGTLGDDRHPLGYIDQEPLPLLDRLELRRMPDTGEVVLVAGERDPLFEVAEPVAELGWVEPLPLNPQEKPHHLGPWKAIDLRRVEPSAGRRHRYAVGADGTFLGGLYPRGGKGLVAVRLRSDGRLVSDLAVPGRVSRNPKRIAGWIVGGVEQGGVATRAIHLAARGVRGLSEDAGEVIGWLRTAGAREYFPLFSTTHPVTGDQLVTARPEVALARGYLIDGTLGWAHLPTERPVDLD